MFKDPQLSDEIDPILQLIDNCIPEKLEIGVYLGGLNFSNRFINRLKYEQEYPEILFRRKTVGPYGVCDNPEQFLSRYRKALQRDKRSFCVSFHHILKNSANAGRGGGWRWHKWGEYIGDHNPKCEYLDDEQDFNDGVYIFHIYQLDGPILKIDFSTGKYITLDEYQAKYEI